MTEEQIEVAVARKIDRLDDIYLHHPSMTKAEYDDAMREIDQWAETELRLVCPVFRHITGGN